MFVRHQSFAATTIIKMFKFVVLCAFVASAVGEPEPGLLYSSPLAQPYATYSSVIPNYSSVPLVASSPIVQTPYAYSGAPLAHWIKKRSAPLLNGAYYPTTYLANPAVSAPLVSSPYYQSTYYGAQLPLVNTHYIKKRSAEPTPQTFLSTPYYGPSTYINTIASTPYLSNPLIPNFYSAPAGIPVAATHLIKKRSAEATPEAAPEAAPEPAADPQLAFASYSAIPTTYYGGAPLINSYPYSTVIKSAPFVANPFVYSSFIKK